MGVYNSDDSYESMFESIFNMAADVKTSVINCGEDLIDLIPNNGMLNQIPIIQTISSAMQFYQKLHDENLKRQIIAFIKALNEGMVTDDEIKRHGEALKKDHRRFIKEMHVILFYLSDIIDTEKAVLEGKFYSAYIRRKDNVTFDVFCELCDITNRLFLNDIKDLRAIYFNMENTQELSIRYNYARLVSVGIMNDTIRIKHRPLVMNQDNKNTIFRDMSDIGKLFCKIGFN